MSKGFQWFIGIGVGIAALAGSLALIGAYRARKATTTQGK